MSATPAMNAMTDEPAAGRDRDAGAARPWYRHAWPWLLMMPPAVAVLGGVTMVVLAVGQPGDLVVADYARIEELTAERFARDEAAAALGLSAVVELASAGGGATRVHVRLDGGGAFDAPRGLVLTLRHAGFAEGDRRIELAPSGGGYAGATALIDGRYDIELAPPGGGWRLAGSVPGVPGTVRLSAQRPAAAR